MLTECVCVCVVFSLSPVCVVCLFLSLLCVCLFLACMCVAMQAPGRQAGRHRAISESYCLHICRALSHTVIYLFIYICLSISIVVITHTSYCFVVVDAILAGLLLLFLLLPLLPACRRYCTFLFLVRPLQEITYLIVPLVIHYSVIFGVSINIIFLIALSLSLSRSSHTIDTFLLTLQRTRTVSMPSCCLASHTAHGQCVGCSVDVGGMHIGQWGGG